MRGVEIMQLGFRVGDALRTAIELLLLFCLLASCGQAMDYSGCQKCLGGGGDDEAHSLQQTSDDGYAVAGFAKSNDYNASSNHGSRDYGIVELGEINCTITAPDKVCPGSTGNVASTAESDADYDWSITNGTITSKSNAQSIKFTAGSSGTIRLTVEVNKKGSRARCIKDIAIKPTVNCSWTSNAPVCDDIVRFNGPAGMDTYQWDFGDGDSSPLEDPIHRYRKFGTYTVKLTVTSCGISKTGKGPVEVRTQPDCSWTSNAPVCNGTPVQFSGPAGMDSYQWDFGDGAISSSKDPSHLYRAPGIYAINLTTTKCNIAKTCPGTVEVKGPDCSWTSNAPVCEGTEVQFSGPSGMDSYYWRFGDGLTSSDKDPAHLYRVPGTYTVKLTVTSCSSSKTCTGSVTVKPQPDCSWTSNAPVCKGTPVQFTGPAGMESYHWDFGDHSPGDRAMSPSHLYQDPGTYTVKLTVTSCGSSKTCTGSVVVTAIDCSWTSNAPVCNGTAVQFNGPAGMDSYQWEFGDNQSSSSKDPSHLYRAPGIYAVNLTVSKGGCTKSCPGSVEVKGPDCRWTSNAPVCIGTPVQFSGPSGMDSYFWDFGDGALSSAQGVSHLYTAPRTYTVSLKATKGSCSASCRSTVVVSPMPDCSWTSNAPVCDGTSVQFTGPSAMDSYYWEFGDGQVGSIKDPAHLYSAPGTYTVNLTVSKGGCSKSCTGSVVVTAIDCRWTSSSPVCNGTAVQFTGPSAMDSYQWEFGDGAVSSAQGVSHLYSAPGTYSVNLKATKGGCSKSCTGSVVVTALDCSWTSNAPVCNGTPVQFTGPAGMDSYYWDFGDGAVSSTKDPSHLYSAPGTYTVNLKVTKGSSSKSCKGLVEVKACPFNSVMSYGELLKSQGELVASFGGLLKNTTLKTDRKDFYNFSHSFDDLVHRQKQGVYSYEDLVSHSWSELSDQQKIEFTDSFESLLRQVANLISCEEDLLKRDWCTLSPEEQGYFLQRFGDDLHYQQMLIHKFEDWLDHQQTMEDSYRDWWMRFLDSFEDLIRRQSNLMDSFEMLMKIDCTEEYISLTRSANVTEVNAGAPVEYTYKVTATRITVKDVVVKDSLGGEIGTIDRLEPGVPQTLTKVKIHSCANCNRCRCKVCSFATVCGEAITVNGNFTTCDVSNDVCVVINETS
jgi:PKD repeat protein